mmetsp:Transcript_9983/g.18957  ORF Transcript_9983/g.18957 Transcript_9983/m.18957 type:complete len:253 (+) Transcript_9983:813-1571(+)
MNLAQVFSGGSHEDDLKNISRTSVLQVGRDDCTQAVRLLEELKKTRENNDNYKHIDDEKNQGAYARTLLLRGSIQGINLREESSPALIKLLDKKARKDLNAALKIFVEQKDLVGQSECHRVLARLAFDCKQDTIVAKEHLEKARRLGKVDIDRQVLKSSIWLKKTIDRAEGSHVPEGKVDQSSEWYQYLRPVFDEFAQDGSLPVENLGSFITQLGSYPLKAPQLEQLSKQLCAVDGYISFEALYSWWMNSTP